MADNKAIASTKKPEEKVDDRTIAVANPPAKKADEKSAELADERGAVFKKKRSKKVLCCWCCGITAGVLLLLGIIIIILVFTVFKVKNVDINVTRLALQGVSISGSIPRLAVSVTAELDLNASIHNPNVAGFKYTNTMAQAFYRGNQVAEAPIAAGSIKAHGNEQIFLPIQVTLSSSELNQNLANDLAAQMLPLVSEVYIRGTVKIGLIHINNVRVHSTCNINYFLNNRTDSFTCQDSTKI